MLERTYNGCTNFRIVHLRYYWHDAASWLTWERTDRQNGDDVRVPSVNSWPVSTSLVLTARPKSAVNGCISVRRIIDSAAVTYQFSSLSRKNSRPPNACMQTQFRLDRVTESAGLRCRETPKQDLQRCLGHYNMKISIFLRQVSNTRYQCRHEIYKNNTCDDFLEWNFIF